jgi:hypothetical protein
MRRWSKIIAMEYDRRGDDFGPLLMSADKKILSLRRIHR